jgi:hypothetical protein
LDLGAGLRFGAGGGEKEVQRQRTVADGATQCCGGDTLNLEFGVVGGRLSVISISAGGGGGKLAWKREMVRRGRRGEAVEEEEAESLSSCRRGQVVEVRSCCQRLTARCAEEEEMVLLSRVHKRKDSVSPFGC